MQGTKQRILIAERNPHMRGFIGRELAAEGFLVNGACNSSELFAVLDSPQLPDLIILSADTPDTEGENLLQRVTERFPRIPVILHIYHESSGDIPDPAGLASAVVEKNGNPDRLTEAVRDLLRSRITKPGTTVEER
ncbi:response regulator [Salidesulfovibrio brasiliensis]